jgi:hypothetical protein
MDAHRQTETHKENVRILKAGKQALKNNMKSEQKAKTDEKPNKPKSDKSAANKTKPDKAKSDKPSDVKAEKSNQQGSS